MSPARLALALAVCGALTACSGGDGRPVVPGAKLDLPALAAGVHLLRLEGDPAGASGLAYVAEDGRAFLQLAPESDTPSTVIYRRVAANAPWQRAPAATVPLSLTLAVDEARASQAEPDWAGSYRSLVGNEPADYAIGSDGRVTPAGTACQLSGALEPAEAFGEARGLRLTLSGCAAANGNYRGAILPDPDAKNARFRAVLSDADNILDLYGYTR